MPVSKATTKKKAPAKKAVVNTPARAGAKKKRVGATKAAKPGPRKPVATKPKAVPKKTAPARGKAPAKAAAKPASRKASAARPPTITVGETQYVLGEYGQLMSMEEYERMMAKKLSG